MPRKVPRLLVVRWVSWWNLGTANTISRTPLGSVNVNYFLATPQVQSVVTFFIQRGGCRLVSCFCLMRLLASNQLPTPILHSISSLTILGWRGELISAVTKLTGTDKTTVIAKDLEEVGRTLAAAHLVGWRASYHHFQTNDVSGIRSNIASDPSDPAAQEKHTSETRLASLLFLTSLRQFAKLGDGMCHCDLFVDNLTFRNTSNHFVSRLTGCLDFYFSGKEKLLIDVGIMTVASCQRVGILEVGKVATLLHAYQTIRPFSLREKKFLVRATGGSSFRFWALRLVRFHQLKILSLLNTYDPSTFC